ncbi:helicase [Ectropis obliqua nucleopolyhedrovirus]|uniref:Helicase n=1 Tax=Ectropis obliqua nucleopolyhedrovirus TaxID=59376 RepID=A0EYX7_9ABAC|nr:helicase [Ectropis obliqua nucleopolyhedrovirus]ABI35757.1 helicase [Ectropis obliqua nucleopolyhedrovirus]ADG21232.1 helicase [Ectropis obliqua nucleopolyhedrovirus]AGS47928.1 ATP-dependent DNA helicase P143 [Ectropis obliqua nucleopolyhedrovirus]QWV59657.1 helicase [Ectropis obliqua nucleopolyhedrovirus]UYO72872.1 helicase [Ectropis obliqua nucleopolyhedrovirus]
MATVPISVDQIFVDIFADCQRPDDAVLKDFNLVDCLILKNDVLQKKQIVKNVANFQRLLQTMRNETTKCLKSYCHNVHDHVIAPHDWYVQGNCFIVMVRPFIENKYYETVKHNINFNQFLQSNKQDYGNECVKANDYYYWPNITISYFGWRLYLQMKFNIDIGDYVPLLGNCAIGNVSLFDFEPDYFVNIEMSLVHKEKKLFVNGRTEFTDKHDALFDVTMLDGSQSVCKINDKLVFSNKNFFNYIRDDINLTKCQTVEKYKGLIRVDLQSLRSFKPATDEHHKKIVTKERLKVNNVITASSENDDIVTHVESCVKLLNEYMTKIMVQHEIANKNVLQHYLTASKYVNFDYMIILIWRLIAKSNNFLFFETDIKLYLELLCEKLYLSGSVEFAEVQKRCEPYTKLTPKVFTRFCAHWTVFSQDNSLESLACYYAIHLMIYNKLSQNNENNEKDCWEYNYENVIHSGASAEIMCKGFFKKIQTANACLVFNGKHYVGVKKDDDLFKLTEKCSAVVMSSIKFNNWKYLYFTDEGVYNLFINDYHDSCPFILGNTLLGALTLKSEKTYLPESVINFMLDTGKIERDIFRIYHVAKLCRDVKMLKSNIAIVLSFDNCKACNAYEQQKLNDCFREIWNFNQHELITLGLYLNENKMSNLVNNLKCGECKLKKAPKKCTCYNEIQIELKTLKIILIIELLSNNIAILELAWSMLYSSVLYTKILMDSIYVTKSTDINLRNIKSNAMYFNTNKTKIVNYLYNYINNIDHASQLIDYLSNFKNFLQNLQNNVENNDDSAFDENESDTSCSSNQTQNENANASDDDDDDDIVDRKKNSVADTSVSKHKNYNHCGKMQIIDNFYEHYTMNTTFLNRWNIWWDKLIVARKNDDLNTWLIRFYTRVILSKINLEEYNHFYINNIVTGYLYFRTFTNFNYINSLLVIHYCASLGIPSDYEKMCLYITGKPGSGKSSNTEILEHIITVHKHNADSYTLSKKETDEMEADKMISQLYVINEMKECNDSFFKTSADSTKSNSVCRKYQGSQKYEANYKLMIINNKPLYISNYDKGVRNRFAIVNMKHEFVENYKFTGSVYSHIKQQKFPMERSYYETLYKPVRLFLSHILMYKRSKRDGYVSYKNIIKNDAIHNYNLMCLDVNNNTVHALLYILNVRITNDCKLIDESKIEKMIEMAAPYVETMIHDSMKLKRNANNTARVPQLCVDFKKKFNEYYRENDRAYCGIDLAWKKNDFNTTPPLFKCGNE